MDLSIFMEANAWIAILTLTFLEIVLGVDNIVFISIVSGKLKEKDQPKARNIGLILAMVFRVALLFAIPLIYTLGESFYDIKSDWFTAGISGQSLIIFFGGLFLLYKGVTEIHHKLEGDEESVKTQAKSSLNSAIFQIAILNIVFSIDSILTAVGLVSLEPSPAGFGESGGMLIMILAVVVSVIIMMVFAGPVSKFVNEHPTIQILGLSFLILIGVMLLVEGSHLAHVSFFGNPVSDIPKGYLYFAIFFSLGVEFLNLKLRKSSKPVKLHDSTIMDEELKDTEIFD